MEDGTQQLGHCMVDMRELSANPEGLTAADKLVCSTDGVLQSNWAIQVTVPYDGTRDPAAGTVSAHLAKGIRVATTQHFIQAY
ncbi:Phosphoglucosamine mutase [Dissostichus eleginoides]|uniref:Phosphoglucosamine mutase n=1 Tax=Dissostichus eleginoides TaxID=100907 RepID=A0AAD9BMU2_DISEL|nr:Phosphoglucosamine mutase [Dissostichus eleginoides]